MVNHLATVSFSHVAGQVWPGAWERLTFLSVKYDKNDFVYGLCRLTRPLSRCEP